MRKLIIRPLEDYFGPGGWRLTRSSLAQLAAKIQRIQTEKLANTAQAHSAWRENTYLQIIAILQKELGRAAALPMGVALKLIDTELRRQHCFYSARRRPVATRNCFYSAAELRAPAYDMAYFNPSADDRAVDTEHHLARFAGRRLSSVFYFRCEPRAEHVLIGNLQIDHKANATWKDLALARTMLSSNNVGRALVHAAVKHGLAAGFSDIIFHAGSAAHWAQFNFSSPAGVAITTANYAQLQTQVQAVQQQLAGAAVGDNFYLGCQRWRIFAADAAGFRVHSRDNTQDSIFWAMAADTGGETRQKNFLFPNLLFACEKEEAEEVLALLKENIIAAGVPWRADAKAKNMNISLIFLLPGHWSGATLINFPLIFVSNLTTKI